MNGLVPDGWEGSLPAWRQICIFHLHRLSLTHESYIVVAFHNIQISALWDLKLSVYTLEYVYPLFDCDKKRLEYLELTSTQDGELLDATLLNADLFATVSLSDNDFTYLVPLKQLKYFELTSTNDGELLDATLLDADLFAAVLSSLPALVSLNLNATNNFSDPFLLALGRQCRSLRDPTLTETFTLKPLATEPSVLFPCLLSLQLGSLTPNVPEP